MSRLTEAQQSELDNGTMIAILWCVDDVIAQASQIGVTITNGRAIDILEAMDSQHDANYGITWETIIHHLSEDNSA